MSQALIEHLVKLGLYFIPLYSIKDGKCTCMNPNCSSSGKHPLLRFNWKIIATNDIKKINRWRERNKYLNFAIATGRRSPITEKYLVVVDMDIKNHDFANQMPKTFAYKTGAGGYHYWFWSKYPIRNSVSLVAKQIDIRGTNGYVVIPPSKHISGIDYELISKEDEEIADLPKFIYDLVKKSREEKDEPKNDKRKQKIETDKLVKTWTEMPVYVIREQIETEKVPKGVRNVTCFRLLASERARGVAELHSLIELAKMYRNYFEEPDTVTDGELEIIAKSVMKYPAYNNNHEKVNDCYFRWLEKNGNKIDENYKLRLLTLDEFFFTKCLQKTSCKDDGTVSLKAITEAREKFLKSNDLRVFSCYKPQLLAKKLQGLGFKRIRTAQSNLWDALIKV